MNHLVSTRTPLRIGLFGGGSDLPEISSLNKGAVLNFAINQYVYVTLKKHSGLFHEKYRLQYSSTEMVDSVFEIKNSIIRTTLTHFSIDTPLIINTISDFPSSSGLGGSSSFTVGLVKALNSMFSLGISSCAVAETAFLIERSIEGSSVGRQDAYAAAIGGFNLFEFADKNSISPVVDSSCLEGILPCLRLIWTGVQRSASDVLRNQIESSCDKSELYRSLVDLAYEAFDLFNSSDTLDLARFSTLLNSNRDIKYQLSPSISSDVISDIEKSLISTGALATKLLGAGGGGFILAVFSSSHAANLSNSLLEHIFFTIGVDYSGSTIVQES